MTSLKVSKSNWKELQNLKLELEHTSLNQTLSYLLYELNKGGGKNEGENNGIRDR